MNRSDHLYKLAGIAISVLLLAGCGSSAGTSSGNSASLPAASQSVESSAESDPDAVIANIVDNTDPDVISKAESTPAAETNSAASKPESTASATNSTAAGSGSGTYDPEDMDSEDDSVLSMPDYATTPSNTTDSDPDSVISMPDYAATAANSESALEDKDSSISAPEGTDAGSDTTGSGTEDAVPGAGSEASAAEGTTSQAEGADYESGSAAAESDSTTSGSDSTEPYSPAPGQDETAAPEDNTNQLRVREILRNYKQDTTAMTLNASAWLYDGETDVYYQLLLPYCANPSSDGEVLGIYVPAAYMDATENADGTFTCAINGTSRINGYTAETAPYVFPVTSTDFEAQEAQATPDPESVYVFTGSGYICVVTGLRGSTNELDRKSGNTVCGGAPWAVTDLKAAIRYCRLNRDVLPGDPDAVFTCGVYAGGTLSEIAGASGDSPLYYTYLTQIGAAMYDKNGSYISDAVLGAAAFDPAASPDTADAAYEWENGQCAGGASRAEDTWTGALSADLAAAYADYVNGLGLSSGGSSLLVEASVDGIFSNGSYCDYLRNVLEESLGETLAEMSSEEAAAFVLEIDPDGEFISFGDSYDVEITDLSRFLASVRPAGFACPAYDTADGTGAYNDLFGTSESDFRHFSGIILSLLNEHATTYSHLNGWNTSLLDTFANDLAAADEVGTDTRTRVNMYSPMSFVNKTGDAAGTSNIAPYFLIRESVYDSETPLTQSVNLQLSLAAAGSDASLEFLWEKETTARPSNAIVWIENVMK